MAEMALVIYFMMLLNLLAPVWASFMTLYPAGATRDSRRQIENPDLVDLIRTRTVQHNRVFSDAIQLLDSMKTSPSCSRIAAMKLLNSCQTLEESDSSAGPDIANTLDRVKSIYAARLALCELSGAGASFPLSCSSIQITSSKTHNDSDSDLLDVADDFPTLLVENCLRGLESRPQWWTSYSNNRQNAIVICQAARIEMEKEEMLNLHKALAKNTYHVKSALQEVLQDAAAEKLQQKTFLDKIHAMREQLTADLLENSSQTRSLFAGLLQDFEGYLGTSISKVLSRLKDVEEDSSALNKGVHDSLADVDHLRYQLNEIYKSLSSRDSELKDLQTRNMKDMESNHDLVLFMQSSLGQLNEKVAGVDAAIEWVIGHFEVVHQQESAILEKLQTFEAHLEISEARATKLLETQITHARALETQAQTQEALSNSAKFVFVLLDKLTDRAANLESMLQEMTSQWQTLQKVDGIFGWTLSIWTAIALLVTLFAVQNPKVAGIVSVVAGFAVICRVVSYLSVFNLSSMILRI